MSKRNYKAESGPALYHKRASDLDVGFDGIEESLKRSSRKSVEEEKFLPPTMGDKDTMDNQLYFKAPIRFSKTFYKNPSFIQLIENQKAFDHLRLNE